MHRSKQTGGSHVRAGNENKGHIISAEAKPLPDWMENMGLEDFENMRSESERRR